MQCLIDSTKPNEEAAVIRQATSGEVPYGVILKETWIAPSEMWFVDLDATLFDLTPSHTEPIAFLQELLVRGIIAKEVGAGLLALDDD